LVIKLSLLGGFRMKVYLAFLFVSCAVLAIITFANPHGGLATAWHRFDTYGWPQRWLHVHTMDTTQIINGQRIPGKHSIEDVHIDWAPFVVSAITAGGISAVVMLPVMVWSWRKDQQNAS